MHAIKAEVCAVSDEIRATELIRFAHCVKNALQLPRLKPEYENPYTNYFYFDDSREFIKLCIPDTPRLREMAKEISNIVWFGHNTDPVEFVPLHEVEVHLTQIFRR